MLLAQWMKALLSSCTFSTAQEQARPVTIMTPWSAGAENADVVQEDVCSCVKKRKRDMQYLQYSIRILVGTQPEYSILLLWRR